MGPCVTHEEEPLHLTPEACRRNDIRGGGRGEFLREGHEKQCAHAQKRETPAPSEKRKQSGTRGEQRGIRPEG